MKKFTFDDLVMKNLIFALNTKNVRFLTNFIENYRLF